MTYRNRVAEAINFMWEHCSEARWDIVARAMDILQEAFCDKKPVEEVGVCPQVAPEN